MEAPATDILTIEDRPEGRVGVLRFHDGQLKALESTRRFILLLAGTQSGKTSFGPYWLYEEIQKRGPGDYLVATPTFTLLELKALSEFKRLFEDHLQLGKYKGSPSRVFQFSPKGEEVIFGATQANPTRILFGHAQDPESLESATIKAAWLDEAGQKKFKLGSWEAIQRRLSIHEGRVLITTTPYTLGWLKNELHDKAKAGDPDIELVQFESVMNPAFPRSEFERMRASMPRWKFNMMYRGIFERPAGMIYDCFSDAHKVPRFAIPDAWPRFLGVDFGGVNTAAVYLAQNPDTKAFYMYRTYHHGSRNAGEHAAAMKKGEPGALTAFGGAKSEGQWRSEFKSGGLPIHQPPVWEVEVGIDRVYELFKENRLFIFDDLTAVTDDLESYSRVLNDEGEPTEKIEDKETYHLLDALRYICAYLNNKTPKVRRVQTM